MAEEGDSVHITGTDLPAWATETTAVAMASALSDLVDLTEKQSRNLQDQLKKNGKVNEEVAKKLGESSGGVGSLKKDLKEAGDSALDSAAGFDEVTKKMPHFGKWLKELPKSLKLGIAGFGMLTAGLAKGVAIIRETAGVMKEMNDSGIRTAGGIRELQHSLAVTGMTLDELQSITSKYSQVVGTNGWKAITKLTASVNEADGGFRKYGITTAEATEFTAEYLEQQRMAGIFGAASQRGQSLAVKENIERLTAYSKTLNVSRKAMMETTTTMLSREDVQAQFALMTPEARKKAQAAFAATVQGFASLGPAGEKFGTLLVDMIANPTAEASAAFKQVAQAAPELARDMVSMAKRVRAGEKVTQEEIMMTLEKAGANKGVLEALTRVDGEIGDMAKSILAASLVRENAEANEIRLKEQFSKESAEVQKAGYEEWLKTSSEAVQGVTGVDDALAKLHATIQEQVAVAFMDLVGDAGGEGVRGLITGIDKLTEMIGSFDDTGWVKSFREFFGEGLQGAIKALAALSAVILLGPYALTAGIPLVFKGLKGLGGMLGNTVKSLGGWGKALGKSAGVMGAAMAGWQIGSAIYDANATGIQDKLAGWFGDEQSADQIRGTPSISRTPDEQKAHDEMRRLRRADAAAARAAEAAGSTTSSASGASTSTPAEPQMSGADIAKLDKADQQLYYLKKIAKQTAGMEGIMA